MSKMMIDHKMVKIAGIVTAVMVASGAR